MSRQFLEKSTRSICPGKYCGYQSNDTDCGVSEFKRSNSSSSALLSLSDLFQACQRGYRVNNGSICESCHEPLSLYNFMYIVFMALLALSFHWYFIYQLRKRKQRNYTLIKYVSIVVDGLFGRFFCRLVHLDKQFFIFFQLWKFSWH